MTDFDDAAVSVLTYEEFCFEFWYSQLREIYAVQPDAPRVQYISRNLEMSALMIRALLPDLDRSSVTHSRVAAVMRSRDSRTGFIDLDLLDILNRQAWRDHVASSFTLRFIKATCTQEKFARIYEAAHADYRFELENVDGRLPRLQACRISLQYNWSIVKMAVFSGCHRLREAVWTER